MGLISTILLTFAYTQGLALSYWRLCLRGSSLAGLHHHWNAGQSLLGASLSVISGHGFLAAIACFAWTISVIRSPLNQSATGIASDIPFPNNGTFQPQVAQRLPESYTGLGVASRTRSVRETAALMPSFADIVREYNTRSEISLDHAECGGTCESRINTFGFCANCTTTSTNVPIYGAGNTGAYSYLFQSDVTLYSLEIDDDPSSGQNYRAGLLVNVTFTTGKNPDNSSEVIQTIHTCYLGPSIMTIPVTLVNTSTISLQSTNWDDDECVQDLDYLGPSYSLYSTTVGGFQLAGSNLFKSSAEYRSSGPFSSTTFSGTLANQYVQYDTDDKQRALNTAELSWSDPTDDIINAIRELAFRASIYATTDRALDGALNNTWMMSNQTAFFSGTDLRATYTTRYSYMIAALALSVIGVIGVLPLYIGWWQLGRKVSMSPLEVARAFDAPLLRGTAANAEVDELARETKGERVRYGVVASSDSDDSPRLMLAGEDEVQQPLRGEVYN